MGEKKYIVPVLDNNKFQLASFVTSLSVTFIKMQTI